MKVMKEGTISININGLLGGSDAEIDIEVNANFKLRQHGTPSSVGYMNKDLDDI